MVMYTNLINPIWNSIVLLKCNAIKGKDITVHRPVISNNKRFSLNYFAGWLVIICELYHRDNFRLFDVCMSLLSLI